MTDRDHQRVEEVERQRGYGEGFRKDKDVKDQDVKAAGYKTGSPVADQKDHESGLVTDMEDERVPNVPNDDTDDASSARLRQEETPLRKPDESLLADAYSVPDPDVEPKE